MIPKVYNNMWKRRKDKQKSKKREQKDKKERNWYNTFQPFKIEKKKWKEWKDPYLCDTLAQMDGQTELQIARYEWEEKWKTERKRKEVRTNGGKSFWRREKPEPVIFK